LAQTRANVSGIWTLNVNLGHGDITSTLNLQQEGDRLRGSIQGPLGAAEISNASASGEIRFTVSITLEGQTKEAAFVGTVAGNEMRGTVSIEGRAPGSFTATRPGPAPAATPLPEANAR
jgi:hypothetical protein